MLGGLEPVIIFQIGKLADSLGTQIAKIPLVSNIPTIVEQPPIPIYLSEELTGMFIESEDKNVDIGTETQTLSSGESPEVIQKGLASVITINLVAKKDSIGLALLSAMIDLIFEKATSKEYAITYLHDSIIVFRGVLHSYSINQTANNELATIKIELSRGQKNPQNATTPTVSGPTSGTIPAGRG